MEYELKFVTVGEVAAGYKDDAEGGCWGYDGKLNIRPAYQREYIYTGKRRDAVVESVMKNLPIGTMYWMKKTDGTFELLDGQQRTISLCQFITGRFGINHRGFKNLLAAEKKQVLEYRLWVCVCEGTDKDTLEWFKVLNTPGTELNAQELRNAIFTGTWLNEAKKYFSRSNCVTVQRQYNKYLDGSAVRQDFLQTALKWIAERDKIKIEDYMAENQDASNCEELWLYFKSVMDWVKATFKVYRREMKAVDWGSLYNRYGGGSYDKEELEKKIVAMLEDEDITSSRGIYDYLFDGQERHLSIRKFSEKIKRATYERQHHLCAKCNRPFPIEKMHADHITPWSKGGRTVESNCQVLCENCNREKSNV
ncbi:MAG: DUF262 domain-containing protein [Selenomonadaceae bacterium]|nr:DUF262 domain-containing protein [Selenomonadaceae bacterium]